MKLLIDVNLSPDWVPVLQRHQHDALHWSTVGDIRASDREIMNWARKNGYMVFTHDLDFGSLLALTHANGPSVLQVRTQDVSPQHLEHLVSAALNKYESLLRQGALIVLDEFKLRARILPL